MPGGIVVAVRGDKDEIAKRVEDAHRFPRATRLRLGIAASARGGKARRPRPQREGQRGKVHHEGDDIGEKLAPLRRGARGRRGLPDHLH